MKPDLNNQKLRQVLLKELPKPPPRIKEIYIPVQQIIEALNEMKKSVEDLKVQVGRISKEVKDAVEMITAPDSLDADAAAAAEALKSAADALEVATAPLDAEKAAKAAEAKPEETPVEAAPEAPVEPAPEAPPAE